MRCTWIARAAVGLTALALVAAGCGGDDDSDSSASTTAANAKVDCPITIGMAVAKTGFAAPYDMPSVTAAQMRIDEINEGGGLLGCELKVVAKDIKSDQALSAPTATEVLEQGANMLMTTADYDFGSPAAQVACDKGVVAFAASASSPNYGVQGIGPCAYTMGIVAQVEGAALADFAANELKLDKAFVLTDTSLAATQQLAEGTKTQIKANGGTIAGEASFKNNDVSLDTVIAKIKGSSADFIVLASYPPGGATAVKQIRDAGVDLPIVAGDGFDGEYWTKSTPKLSDFYYGTFASTFGDDPDEKVNEFVAKYKEKTGEQPMAFALAGYSVIQAFEIAAKRANSVAGDAVEAQLDTFKDVPLLVGPTTFTAERHFAGNRPIRIMQIQDGTFSYKATIEPGDVEVSFGS